MSALVSPHRRRYQSNENKIYTQDLAWEFVDMNFRILTVLKESRVCARGFIEIYFPLIFI
jgi:hypothetical protein